MPCNPWEHLNAEALARQHSVASFGGVELFLPTFPQLDLESSILQSSLYLYLCYVNLQFFPVRGRTFPSFIVGQVICFSQYIETDVIVCRFWTRLYEAWLFPLALLYLCLDVRRSALRHLLSPSQVSDLTHLQQVWAQNSTISHWPRQTQPRSARPSQPWESWAKEMLTVVCCKVYGGLL